MIYFMLPCLFTNFKIITNISFIMYTFLVCWLFVEFMNCEVYYKWVMVDSTFFLFTTMTLWIMILITHLPIFKSSSLSNKMFLFSIWSSIMFYFSCNWVLSFIFFEISILPIIILIMSSGTQPERIRASVYMLLYSLLGSVPFLLWVLYLKVEGINYSSNWFLVTLPFQKGGLSLLLGFLLPFLMKAPLFSVHSWLPKAHVEAPMGGSMVLASVLLKLGSFGMIRIMPIISYYYGSNLWNLMICLAMIGTMYSSISSVCSTDVKMIVAFSSISHMNLGIAGLMNLNHSAMWACVISNVSHGLSSSLLFFMVSIGYFLSNSRSVLMIKGLMPLFPTLSSGMVVGWSVNMGLPPFLSFLGEISLFSSVLSKSMIMLVVISVYFLMSSSYSILSFCIMNHSKVLSNYIMNNGFYNINLIMMFFMLSSPSFMVFTFIS